MICTLGPMGANQGSILFPICTSAPPSSAPFYLRTESQGIVGEMSPYEVDNPSRLSYISCQWRLCQQMGPDMGSCPKLTHSTTFRWISRLDHTSEFLYRAKPNYPQYTDSVLLTRLTRDGQATLFNLFKEHSEAN